MEGSNTGLRAVTLAGWSSVQPQLIITHSILQPSEQLRGLGRGWGGNTAAVVFCGVHEDSHPPEKGKAKGALLQI